MKQYRAKILVAVSVGHSEYGEISHVPFRSTPGFKLMKPLTQYNKQQRQRKKKIQGAQEHT